VTLQRVNDRDVIEFSVTDSGRGLTAEVSARLYEAFYSTKADGMGIGLSLCRSIVESHLGRMKAENLYNGPDASGCVFSFWLPCIQAETTSGIEPKLTAKDAH
jgi:signal transduction histidine kinase